MAPFLVVVVGAPLSPRQCWAAVAGRPWVGEAAAHLAKEVAAPVSVVAAGGAFVTTAVLGGGGGGVFVAAAMLGGGDVLDAAPAAAAAIPGAAGVCPSGAVLPAGVCTGVCTGGG